MKIIKLCTVVLCAAALILSVIPSAYAAKVENSTSTETDALSGFTNNTEALTDSDISGVELLKNPSGRTVGVSNRGEWHSYPENSLEAVIAAANKGIDFVLTDINITSDGVLILFADNTTDRMLNLNESKTVSDMTFAEISSYNLKNCSGGKNNAVTEYKVCTLEAALEKAKETGFCLMPKVSTELTEKTYELIKQKNMLNSTCVYVTGSKKEVINATKNLNGLNYITGLQNNIVFVITSFIDANYNNGAVGINLMTTNRYGVNFNQTVLKHFNGTLRAVAATCNSETCGAREDTVKWWDDLISRGYSVIITDDCELFINYLAQTNEARAKLSETYERYTSSWKLPEFKSYIFNDYKKAYSDAITECEKLITDLSSSQQAMLDATNALQNACDAIDEHYEELEHGTAGMTVTLPRILLCIAAAVLVICVQIFFYKKRRKA